MFSSKVVAAQNTNNIYPLWRRTYNPKPYKSFGHASCTLPGTNKIVVYGGAFAQGVDTNQVWVGNIDVNDPLNITWTNAGTYPSTILAGSAIGVTANKFVAINGFISGNNYSTAVYIGTVSVNNTVSFTSTNSYPDYQSNTTGGGGVVDFRLVFLQDGRIMLIGGIATGWNGSVYTYPESNKVYIGNLNTSTNTITWSTATNLIYATSVPSCCQITDGRVIVFGGNPNPGSFGKVQIGTFTGSTTLNWTSVDIPDLSQGTINESGVATSVNIFNLSENRFVVVNLGLFASASKTTVIGKVENNNTITWLQNFREKTLWRNNSPGTDTVPFWVGGQAPRMGPSTQLNYCDQNRRFYWVGARGDVVQDSLPRTLSTNFAEDAILVSNKF